MVGTFRSEAAPAIPPLLSIEQFERETVRELAGSELPIVQGEDDTDREERDLARRVVEAPILARDPEPERKWIVEDVIPDETLTLLTGNGGIGKTTLAEQLAVAMRIDGDWLGMKVTQGPVLFVTSEDDRKDVNLNLRAILKAEGKSLAHCPDLHILPLADRDAVSPPHRQNSGLSPPRRSGMRWLGSSNDASPGS